MNSNTRETQCYEKPNSTNVGAGILLEHRELERVAETALCTARLLMETGVPATVVHEECCRVAPGLGAEHVDLRSGYASLGITIATGTDRVTRLSGCAARFLYARLGIGSNDLAVAGCIPMLPGAFAAKGIFGL